MKFATAGLPCLAMGFALLAASAVSAQNRIEPVAFATAEPAEYAQLVTAPLPPSRRTAFTAARSARPAQPARHLRPRTDAPVQRVAYNAQQRRAETRWPLTMRPHVFSIGTVY